MNKVLIIPKQTVTADGGHKILNDSAVEITDNIISSFIKKDEIDIAGYSGEVVHAENLTLIPGFIQTHIHLCQTLFRGMADDLELLDWLQHRIFPYENAHNPDSLRASVRLGINELMRGGTTTLMDMGTLRHQEVIFEELINSGMRAFAGKCMMDVNDLYPAFKSATSDELKYSEELAAAYHGAGEGRIKYGFAPRFVLSCSEGLLKETKSLSKNFEGSLFHTHSSENKNECAEVRKRHNKENIEYFDSVGVLDNNTVLAHCIHVSENEISTLKEKETKVSHCPSSNLKLGSGVADIPRYMKEGISVSLGADGAPCNNNLSALTEMRLASLIQKPVHGPTVMDAETVFRMATIEGAKALNIQDETGSIEVGKKADLVLLNLDSPYHSLNGGNGNIYSNIVYSAFSENVSHVMIDGKWTVKDGRALLYDEKELLHTGRNELGGLLNRI